MGETMDDKLIFSDIMAVQNQLAFHCGRLAAGCTTPQFRDTVWNVLNEEFLIQGELVDESKKRAWIRPVPASTEAVRRIRQRAENE